MRTDEEPVRTGLILVPMDALPASRIVPKAGTSSACVASGSHDVVFDDVPVPAENRPIDLRPPRRLGRAAIRSGPGLEQH